eukprot:scaffold22268_cov57-Phaeocystis_antarctica.AAC.1
MEGPRGEGGHGPRQSASRIPSRASRGERLVKFGDGGAPAVTPVSHHRVNTRVNAPIQLSLIPCFDAYPPSLDSPAPSD